MSIEIKAAVSVAEMARMVGLSRPRFYQLIGSAFPWPVYDVSTRRPFYDEEAQQLCLEVRRRHCGMNGRPIMFYAKRSPLTASSSRSRKPMGAGKKDTHHELIESLKSLGLNNVSGDQVTAVVKELFPSGVAGIEPGEMIRAVFVKIKRQNQADKVVR